MLYCCMALNDCLTINYFRPNLLLLSQIAGGVSINTLDICVFIEIKLRKYSTTFGRNRIFLLDIVNIYKFEGNDNDLDLWEPLG
jgi:hypothetical protein